MEGPAGLLQGPPTGASGPGCSSPQLRSALCWQEQAQHTIRADAHRPLPQGADQSHPPTSVKPVCKAAPCPRWELCPGLCWGQGCLMKPGEDMRSQALAS